VRLQDGTTLQRASIVAASNVDGIQLAFVHIGAGGRPTWARATDIVSMERES
jgi:hypothetical protein